MPENIKNLPRDVFMYLLAVVTLVVSAVSFGILVFQYISIYFPDILTDYYYSKSAYFGTIRQSMAFLIVVFPVYIWASRFLRRDLEENPEKKDLKIRKWLLYLTVFAAGLTIIGDLVALLNTFLEGEITTRFILKILTIFFIAGSVFYYYFKELKSKYSLRLFPWAIILVALAAVVFGFFVAGTPADRRLVRFDERRVNDLSIIQSQVINYWQNKGALSTDLNNLRSDITGFEVPVDPKTGEAYEYRVMGDLKFQLCATFETSSDESQNGKDVLPMSYPYPDDNLYTWQHGIGRTCFERTIDPDFLKPPRL